ncbi:hypothetical protein ABZX85_09640 [Streptomyces sp. NPDC004539]|uniref:hypothetical protein n=1 Tax=Streptomyces sp. NPDC004539 TaxID=3154280 RepID=UPI0033BCB9F6
MHCQVSELKNSLLRTAALLALFAVAAFTFVLGSAGHSHSVSRAGDSSEAVVYTPDWNSTGS